MSLGYEIKFWDRALTEKEILDEYLISISDGQLDFSEPEPEPASEGTIFINSSDLGDNIIIDITQPEFQPETESEASSQT